jgi:hypothetical protein
MRYLAVGCTMNIRVQFTEILAGLLCSGLAQTVLAQKKVDSQVRLRHDCRINNRKAANAWQHEVLEGFHADDAGRSSVVNTEGTIGIDEENVGALELCLSARSP